MVKKLLIVGGGITGLSAAYYAQKQCVADGIQAHITLVEQANTLGGKIQTLHRDGFIIERGPDSFLARKKPIIDLTLELNLAEQLVPTNPQASKTYILKDGRFHRIPAGLVLGIPTKLWPFMKSRLISPKGKLRALFDFVMPSRLDEYSEHISDESLGTFLERRLGKEVRRYMSDPLLAGIYAGDTNALSLQATFPQFQQFEAAHGSIIKGMVHSRRHSASASALPSAVQGSVFLSYRRGLHSLVEALQAQLQHVTIQTDVGVRRIREASDSALPHFNVAFSTGESWSGDALIVTTPPHELASMLGEHTQIAPITHHIKYASVANVVLAYARRHMTHALDGSGFVVPRSQRLFMTACTWTSSKWPHIAPDDCVLLRCYVGHAMDERWMMMSDDEIVNQVRAELGHLMGIHTEPLFYELKRWERAMPQYVVGHVGRMDELERELEAKWPGLYVAGAGYAGVGIPDCIAQGKRAAERAVQHIYTK